MAATRRAPQRGAGFLGRLHQVVGTALVLAEHQRQRPVAHQPLDDFPALARVERVQPGQFLSSDERRVGKEGVSTCRSRWSQYPKKNKNQKEYTTQITT